MIEEQARIKARRDEVPFETALETIVKELPASPRVMTMIRDAKPLDTGPQPYEFVAQLKLFRAGLLGESVTLWSSYEGGYGPTQVEMSPGEPVVVHLADEDIETQVRFAASYVAGYIEGVGGELEKARIWLVAS